MHSRFTKQQGGGIKARTRIQNDKETESLQGLKSGVSLEPRAYHGYQRFSRSMLGEKTCRLMASNKRRSRGANVRKIRGLESDREKASGTQGTQSLKALSILGAHTKMLILAKLNPGVIICPGVLHLYSLQAKPLWHTFSLQTG